MPRSEAAAPQPSAEARIEAFLHDDHAGVIARLAIVADSRDDAEEAAAAFASPVVTDSNDPGVGALGYGAVHGGVVYRVDSEANGGLEEFELLWTDGRSFVNVSVLGANMTLAEARSVAQRVGR